MSLRVDQTAGSPMYIREGMTSPEHREKVSLLLLCQAGRVPCPNPCSQLQCGAVGRGRGGGGAQWTQRRERGRRREDDRN